MPMMAEQGEQGYAIRLEGETDIAQAAELKSALVEAVASGHGLTLDLSGVRCLDVTVVQLLVALMRAASLTGVELRVSAPLAGPLREVMAICGVDALLGTLFTDVFLKGN